MAGELDAVEIREVLSGVEFAIKVVPGASRTKVVGVWGSAVKIAVSAPPEGGKANAAVVKLLADVLCAKRSDVAVVSGHGRANKRIVVRGLSATDLRQRLAGL